jgi:hypothetical protein
MIIIHDVNVICLGWGDPCSARRSDQAMPVGEEVRI